MFNKQQRKIILERDNYKCFLCNKNPKRKCELHIHHIKPLFREGNDSFYNLITLCQKCHSKNHNNLIDNISILIKFKKWTESFQKPKNWNNLSSYIDRDGNQRTKLILDLPNELHQKLKIFVATNKTNMQKVIRELITKLLKK